jgi:hypothetical protein
MQYLYVKRFLKYRLDANDRCSMANTIELYLPKGLKLIYLIIGNTIPINREHHVN